MTTATPTIPDHADLGSALQTLAREFAERTAPAMPDMPHGVRGYHVLSAVHRCAHPTQAALGLHLGIDRTVLTYLLDDLEAAGLAARQVDPTDRRRRRIVATERGLGELAVMCARVREAEEALLGRLDDDERAQLRALVAKAAGGG